MLVDLLPRELDIPEEVEDAAALTDNAVISRYPGDIEPVVKQQYHEALRLAEKVVTWAENVICKY